MGYSGQGVYQPEFMGYSGQDVYKPETLCGIAVRVSTNLSLHGE